MTTPDNADLLTNACRLLERYREDERLLTAEIAAQQERLRTIREVILALSGKPQGRPRRSPRLVEETPVEMPLRVGGGINEPDLVA
jgi:hypothetical protein